MRRPDDGQPEGSVTRMSDVLARDRSETAWSRLKRFVLWVAVDVNRWSVVCMLAAVVFVSLVSLVLFAPVSVRAYLLEGTLLSKGYVELQTMVVTVITIVLAINQLVLSPELGTVGDQRSRFESVIEERRRLRSHAEVPTVPTAPVEYLRTLLATTRLQATHLQETFADSDDAELRRRVDEYADGVRRETERVERALDGEEFGTITMISAVMHVTTSDDIRAINEFCGARTDALSEAEREALEEMRDVVSLYTVAREYFRALYVQWEFIDFSRAILVTALPALLVAHVSVGFVDAGAFPRATLGVLNLLWYESAAFTVSVLPVLVVLSYAARLSMVARGTIFVSPFSPGRGDY